MMRTVFLFVLGGLAVSLASCGQSEARKPTFAVTGRVLDGSKPLAHATVVFHPLDEADAAPKPRGKTDETGTFRLTTYDADDGAPVGKYQVTVEQWATVHPEQGPVNRVAAKYANPAVSGFTADVSTGPNEPKVFTLKR
ncbi:MAG: carboxypeptidase-like regulatory domain-containing protein [Gemmataceae bacterium]